MYTTESQQTINELLLDMKLNFYDIGINDPIDVSELNYQLMTRDGKWNNIKKVIRKSDDIKYNVIYDDNILECNKEHAILVKFNNNYKFKTVGELYKNENNFMINNNGYWVKFTIEKTDDIIPIVDFELDGDHTYLSNGIVSHNSMFGDPWTTSGGKSLPFHSSTRIRLKNMGQIKVGTKNDIVGMKCKAQVIKNRLGPPLRHANFNLYFESGIDDMGSWLQVLKDHKLLKQGGAWYTIKYNGEEIKFQSKDFENKLEEIDGLKEYLYDQICEASILKYQTADLGIDDVVYTDDVVGDE